MGKCCVCGKFENVKAVASIIAPVSYCRCEECIRLGAEAIGIIFFWIYVNGGPQAVSMLRGEVISFEDDRYLSWREISALYAQNIRDVEDLFNNEFAAISR